MLVHFGVIPYLVFDGDYLPSKAITEVERSKKREESKRIGLELHRMGKQSQAHMELQKAVDVTPEMARELIEELKMSNVQYVVAPYEADAQLVYLEKKGIISGILSEDSDMLVFGANLLLTKLDQYGDCIAIHRNEFTACREISLVGWSDAEFRRMAILSGCDYLPSINKMGLKTAYRLIRKHKSIEKILRMLQFDGQFHVPSGYLEEFRKAELTFLHQRVFCPEAKKLVMATELAASTETEDLAFIGKDVEPHIARGVAVGDLNPITKVPIVVKTRNFGAPKTPWVKSRKEITGPEVGSDLKSKKPINLYYKPYRMPLAELDINTLTPSPTQSLLLDQYRGVSWSSSPAPSPVVTPDARSRTSLPSSSVQNTPSTITRPTRPRSTPTPGADLKSNPPKRLRLCEDVDETLASLNLPKLAKVEPVRSPFFSSTVPSFPTEAKVPRKGRKSKISDFNIWSDDSIEEAMAAMPDISSQPGLPVASASIDVDHAEADDPLAKPKEMRELQSPATGATVSSTELQNSATDNTPSMSNPGWLAFAKEPLTPSINHTQAETLIATQEDSVKSEFSLDHFRNNHFGATSLPREAKTTPKTHYKSKIPLPQQSYGLVRKSYSSTGALRLIGQRALGNKGIAQVVAATEVEGDVVQIRRSPEVEEILSSKGSEDLLVPNSEDENDHTSSPQSKTGDTLKEIDLKQFVFAV